MEVITPSQELSDEELGRRGLEIYEQRLKPLLEPHRNGQKVAVCVEDADYELGETIPEVDARLRLRHPDAVFFYATVGDDYVI